MSHYLDTYTNTTISDFLDELVSRLETFEFDHSKFTLDHICYRVESEERYLYFKNILLSAGHLIVESEVNGRQISVFKLTSPIHFGKQKISVFELPSPKKGSNYKEGYEHVEFVVPFQLEDLILLYPNLAFNTKDLHLKINRDIRLKLGQLSVKFHEQSLEKVIEVERNC